LGLHLFKANVSARGPWRAAHFKTILARSYDGGRRVITIA